jgi:hypothetical protein
MIEVVTEVFVVIGNESDYDYNHDHIDSVWTHRDKAIDRARACRDKDKRRQWKNRKEWMIRSYPVNEPDIEERLYMEFYYNGSEEIYE